MIGDSEQGWFEGGKLRRLVPLFALAVAVVAWGTEPSTTSDLTLVALSVVAFFVWAYVPRMPLWVLTVVVIVPTVFAQRTGELEPLMFEASVLAFVVGRWSPSLRSALPLGAAAVATPLLVAAVQDPAEVGVANWVLGTIFPWALGRALASQEQLAIQLDDMRAEMNRQALFDERRQIARDVHDFVGHGLAAVMLQITSARHVMRRDPAAAEDALRSAEAVGRRSMQELRRTVTVLRSSEDGGAEPLPSVDEIPALVDQARAGGIDVELRMPADVRSIPPGVGVALYRITQEALANAARHAPRAHTDVELALADGVVSVVAESSGPLIPEAPSDRGRPRYGLVGMQERATALGGALDAGPIPHGWRVTCEIPL
ncbi:MAG TPA: histidine kinase, partial [Actinomycetota bacterium]|nr:histidine kinase [Actinomycetota bacterium]